MPIQPRYKWLYPLNWPQLSALIRFTRAKGRCEGCGRPHGSDVIHLGDGRWWDEARQSWRNSRGRLLCLPPPVAGLALLTTRVVTAHLDHDTTNKHVRNLKAFCQRCHMLNDRAEHQRRRQLTLRMRKAIGDLFLSSSARTGSDS